MTQGWESRLAILETEHKHMKDSLERHIRETKEHRDETTRRSDKILSTIEAVSDKLDSKLQADALVEARRSGSMKTAVLIATGASAAFTYMVSNFKVVTALFR